jgi:hypothetical protein
LGSFNTLGKAAAQAGPRQPADQAAGWKRYEYEVNTRSDNEGWLWVAVGISVMWETKVTYVIDDLRIEIKPS